MADRTSRSGDAHEPVEDAYVPLGLKLLVLVMFALLVTILVLVGLTLYRMGLLTL